MMLQFDSQKATILSLHLQRVFSMSQGYIATLIDFLTFSRLLLT